MVGDQRKLPLVPVYSLFSSGLFLHDQKGRLLGARIVEFGDDKLLTGALCSGCQFSLLKVSAYEEAIINNQDQPQNGSEPEFFINAIWVLVQQEAKAAKYVRIPISKEDNLIEPGEVPDTLEIMVNIHSPMVTIDEKSEPILIGQIDFTLLVDTVSGMLTSRFNPFTSRVEGYELNAYIQT